MTGRVEFSQNSQERNLEDQRASTTPCVRVAGSRPATDRVRALASEAGARVVEEGAGSCEFVLVGGTQAEVVAALGQSAGLPAIALVRGGTPGGVSEACRAAGALDVLDLDAATPALLERALCCVRMTRRLAALEAELAEHQGAAAGVEAGWSFLARAGAELNSSLDYHTTLTNVARAAVPDVADWCVVDLATPSGGLERLAVAHADPARLQLADELGRRYPEKIDAAAGPQRVVRTGEPELVPEIGPDLLARSAQDEAHLALLLGLGLRSYMCVPLRSRARVFGAITFVSAESGRRYGPGDLSVALELANRATAAIENATLYREAQRELAERVRAEENLTARLGELESVHRLSEQVARAAGVEGVYEAALEALGRALGAERSAILLFDDDDVMRFKAWRGLSDGYRSAVEGHSPWTRDHPDPQAFGVEDVLADEALAPFCGTITAEGIRALVFIPLVAEGQVLGKFMAYFPRPHRLTEPEARLAQTIANHVAFAIGRRRAEDALRRNERLLRELVEALPAALYTTDAEGRITMFNQAAVEFSGTIPKLGSDRWCVSWKLYHPDGTPLAHEDCPMAVCLRENRAVRGQEAVAERPDGTRVPFIPYPTPLRDAQGRLVGAVNMLVDISERKAAEESLRTSAERLRIALDAGHIGEWEWDIASGQVTWSDHLFQLHGMTASEFAGTLEAWRRVVHPDDLHWVEARLAAAMWQDEPYELEFRTVRPGGEVRWVSTFARVLRDPGGQPRRMIGCTIDITERRAAEQALRDSEAELRVKSQQLATYLETAAIGLHRVGPDGTILWANQAELDMLGYAREEYVGRHIADFHADREVIEDILSRLRRGEKIVEYEARLRCRDSSVKTVLIDSSVLWNEHGEFVHTQCFTRDITARRAAEQALRESEERLRLLADSMPALVSSLDRELRYRFVNRAYEEWFGVEPGQVLGRTVEQVLGLEASAAVRPRLERALAGESVSFEAELPYRDGGRRYVAATYVPERGPDGDVRGLYVMVHDLTARRQVEERLAESRSLLAASQRMAHVGSWVLELGGPGDVAANALRWSDETYRIFGYEPGGVEVGNELFFRHVHPEDRERIREAVAAALRQGSTYELEHRITRRDGQERIVQEWAVVENGPDGRALRMLGSCQDITERKRDEMAAAHLAAVVRSSDDAIVSKDLDGTIRSWNEGAERLFGYSAAEVVGRHITIIIPPDRHGEETVILSKVRRGEPVEHYETVRRRKDGTLIDVSLVISPVRDVSGKVIGASKIARDVTERNRARVMQRERETRLALAVEGAKFATWERELATGTTLTSDRLQEIFGCAVRDGEHWLDLIHPEDRAGAQAAFDSALTTGGHYAAEYRVVRPDGQVRWVQSRGTVLRDAAGTPERVIGIAADITERKLAEQSLRASEERLRAMFDQAAVGIASTTLDGVLVEVNEKFCAIVGRPYGEVVGARGLDFTFAEDAEKTRAMFRQLRSGGQQEVTLEKRYLRPDGAPVWVSVSATVLRDPAGNPERVLGVVTDIDERKRAEAALRESERRFRLMADNAPVLIWLADVNQQGTYFNRTWLEFTGRKLEEELGEGWLAGVHPDDRAQVVARYAGAFAERVPFSIKFRLRTAGGHYRWVLDTATPRRTSDGTFSGYIGSCLDITPIEEASRELAVHRDRLEELVTERSNELERAHRKMRMTERMASIGTLAAGLGHDMGNLLFPIRARLDVMKKQAVLPGVPRELADGLDAVEQCTDYLQSLARGLRLLSLDPSDKAVAGAATILPAWWKDSAALLKNVLPRNVRLEADLEPDLPALAIAPQALSQAIMNLVGNAGDALRERGSGTVLIWAEALENGRRVRLGVTDDGPGMTEEVRRHALEPFFTTKTRGLSTGLGLSLVHGAVTAAGGRVEIQSEPGQGTTVVLEMPAVEETALRTDDGGSLVAAISVGDARIRMFVSAMLGMQGFDVRVANGTAGADVCVWITEPSEAALAEARRFLAPGARRRVVVLGEAGPEWSALGAVVVAKASNLVKLREALAAVPIPTTPRADPGQGLGAPVGAGVK